MIFTRHGVRWMVDDRGFLRFAIDNPKWIALRIEVGRSYDDVVLGGEHWIRYGWMDLV